MKKIVNETIIPLINNGVLSMRRVNDLIFIKEFIDSISKNDFVELESVDDIKNKFGVKPNIITWGDYFQTEMASSLIDLSDDEFAKAVDTLKYDVISSYRIFSENSTDFLDWVENNFLEIVAENKQDLTEEEQEVIHLKILKDYYLNLGISGNFSKSLMKWYNSFSESMAM
ncbi:hypothetical protein ACFL20_04440 [Spirochaetota bacterium]